MNDSTTEAMELAELGLRVFPVRPLDKRPAVTDWPNVASCDLEMIEGWFALSKTHNVGVRCGTTEVGVDFFVVDVDIKDDQPGKESWAEFCRQHPEVREAAAATVMSHTPSGGWHFWFVVPEGSPVPSNGKPWPGVDIRGEGGYVLAPPSKLENGVYTWVRDPWENTVLEAPVALIEALVRPTPQPEPVRPSPASTPTPVRLATGDFDPIAWAKQHFNVYDFMLRQGWQAGRQRGSQEEITRPGKSSRDGTSATMHHDSNIVNIHTSTVPAEFVQLGHPTRNGGLTLNGFDCWMVENGFTSVSAAMSEIRRQVMPVREPGSAGCAVQDMTPTDPGSTVHEGGTAVEPVPGSNLPDDFWESREWLAHIRTAAHSRMASADAILGAVFARYSATIPVTYRIPPIVMAASTFDHMSVLVSESSGGKSGAAHIAKELLPPIHEKVIRWDQPVGSGEGLVELFYDWVTEENDKGKMVEVHKKVFNAVHFTADEGMALVQTSRRDSTTIGSILCSAWTGTQLGQANASRDRKRIVEAGTGRVAGVMGIQLSLGHHLLADEWVRQGLSGRLVFFAAEDPTIPAPADMPAWPGPLDVHHHPIVPLEIGYNQQIIDEIRHDHWTRTTGQRHEAPIDGHTRLAKLKISGMIALIEGRQTVTVSDWELAGQILVSSTNLRNRMLAVKQLQDRDASHTRAIATAETEMIKETHKERKLIARLCDSIIAKVPEEGISIGKLKRAVTSSETRHRFDAALDQAVERGAVAVDNEHVHRA